MAISKRLRYEVLRRDGNVCRYCGCGGTAENPLVVDHVMPSSLGGSDHPSNLVASCTDCNAGKTSSLSAHVTVSDLPDEARDWALQMCGIAWKRVRELEQQAARAAKSAVTEYAKELLDEYAEDWDADQIVDEYNLDIDARLTGDAQAIEVVKHLFQQAIDDRNQLCHSLDVALKFLPSELWLESGQEAQSCVFKAGDNSWVTYLATHARLARQMLPSTTSYAASAEAQLASVNGPF